MKFLIKKDLFRYNGLTGYIAFFKGLKFPGFRYMYFFRLASGRKKYSPIRILSELMLRRYSYKFGFQIPSSTKIGGGFYIGHHGNIIVNANTVFGDNCNISPLVTIGRTNRGKLKGVPTFGDLVWIGTGAVIVGNIDIGSNVLIAPNSYVNFNIPSNSIVIGNPAKIISKKNPTLGYINNILKS
jgi:serine O-acetyltransferase